MSTTVLTCMDVIKLSVDEPDAVSCLVAGTESGRVLILNPQGTAIVKNIFVGSAPAFMAIHGELGELAIIESSSSSQYQIKFSLALDIMISVVNNLLISVKLKRKPSIKQSS